jgi:pantoate--beta-alanine ligase
MSSRNMRLNEAEKIQALNIIKVLQYIQEHIEAGDVVELAQNARILLEKEGFIVDYVAIADAQTLRNIEVWDGKQKIVALVAAYLNEVRLIDNIILR